MPKSKSSPSLLGACFLPTIALVILAIIALMAVLLTIPASAQRTFGAPTAQLHGFGRFILSARLLWQRNDLTKPLDPNGLPHSFRVELGESTTSVVTRLQKEGLIASATALRNYLQYTGLDTTLQAGDYVFSAAMTAIEIAHALQSPTPGEVTFNILPGWRMEEIAEALLTSGLNITPEEFLDAARLSPSDYGFPEQVQADGTCEGFLAPDSYKLPRDLTATELVTIFLSHFEELLTPEIREGFTQQGLSLYEAVTLASIVDREAVQDEEMPKIASVFLNRLAISMKLDSDPTVQYALGYNEIQKTWWTNPLTDTGIGSPYNTYLYPGLPPGPISNPSLKALRAVAFPEQTSYYYFRAACDHSGWHNFAETYEEHKANACP